METTQKTHTPGPWHLHDMEQNTVCGPDHLAIAFANTRRNAPHAANRPSWTDSYNVSVPINNI